MKRSPGPHTPRPLLAALLLLVSGLTTACGGVVVGATPSADLRVEGAVVVTPDQVTGEQAVEGAVVNTGSATADGVEVVLTVFVADLRGNPVPWQTVAGEPVVNRFDGTQTLFPGERGDFAVTFVGAPPIIDVEVQIEARFRPDGDFFFFIFTPGIVIIGG